LVVPLPQVQRDLARQAGGEADEAFVVALQHLAVDARPPVVTLEEPDGRELDQVVVSPAVPREQDEMRVDGGSVRRPLALQAAAEREIGIEPLDRPEVSGIRLGIVLTY